jgi:bifunctional non-homologous end joining protein LigD
MKRPEQNETIRVEERIVQITRPEKLLFPADGVTKRELVEYYQRIAPVMLPHLHGRPIAMERYPDGIESPGFFQKKAPSYYPHWIKTALLKKEGGVVRHVICDDAATLVFLANQAVITPHAWLSRVDQPKKPDQMIFDLDPSGGDFRAVCAAAKDLRELLRQHRLKAFVKTTGSRGLHVLVPLIRLLDFDEVRAFARQIAVSLVKIDPERLTIDIRKTKRRGRIFVDTARNAYAQTAAPAYAVRASDGAPIAAPLHWDELDNPARAPDQFNIRNIFDRLERMHDPWKDLKQHAQKLPRRMNSDAA